MTVSNWVAVLLFAVLFICFMCLEREHQKRITSEFTAELRQSNIDELHRAIEKCEERERASAELMRAKDERISVLEYELSAAEELCELLMDELGIDGDMKIELVGYRERGEGKEKKVDFPRPSYEEYVDFVKNS